MRGVRTTIPAGSLARLPFSQARDGRVTSPVSAQVRLVLSGCWSAAATQIPLWRRATQLVARVAERPMLVITIEAYSSPPRSHRGTPPVIVESPPPGPPPPPPPPPWCLSVGLRQLTPRLLQHSPRDEHRQMNSEWREAGLAELDSTQRVARACRSEYAAAVMLRLDSVSVRRSTADDLKRLAAHWRTANPSEFLRRALAGSSAAASRDGDLRRDARSAISRSCDGARGGARVLLREQR